VSVPPNEVADSGAVGQALDRHIDPVAQAAEYQLMLTGLVDDREPAEIEEETPSALERLVEAAGPHLRTRPSGEEWSVLELLGHLVDAEIVYAARYRWTLAHDEPTLLGYDQDLWVDRLRHNEDDPAALLELFRVLRRTNLELWRRTPESERGRTGIHSERGPESLELSFRLIAGHDRFHLAQMERTLAEVAQG
jgi:hypothetical protein